MTDSINDKQTGDHEYALNVNKQDKSTPIVNPNVTNQHSNPDLNSGRILASTPWKTKNSQVKYKSQFHNDLSTVLEEREFPPIRAAIVDNKKDLEALLDKFMNFMVNLYLELLPISCVRERFNNLTDFLIHTEQSNTSGGHSL